ncbi:hypothetical protein NR798_13745 [Archangium gephyra]
MVQVEGAEHLGPEHIGHVLDALAGEHAVAQHAGRVDDAMERTEAAQHPGDEHLGLIAAGDVRPQVEGLRAMGGQGLEAGAHLRVLLGPPGEHQPGLVLAGEVLREEVSEPAASTGDEVDALVPERGSRAVPGQLQPLAAQPRAAGAAEADELIVLSRAGELREQQLRRCSRDAHRLVPEGHGAEAQRAVLAVDGLAEPGHGRVLGMRHLVPGPHPEQLQAGHRPALEPGAGEVEQRVEPLGEVLFQGGLAGLAGLEDALPGPAMERGRGHHAVLAQRLEQPLHVVGPGRGDLIDAVAERAEAGTRPDEEHGDAGPGAERVAQGGAVVEEQDGAGGGGGGVREGLGHPGFADDARAAARGARQLADREPLQPDEWRSVRAEQLDVEGLHVLAP